MVNGRILSPALTGFAPCANRLPHRLLNLHNFSCYKSFTKNVSGIGNLKLLRNIRCQRQKKTSKFTWVNTNATGCETLLWFRLTIRNPGTDFNSVRCCCSLSVCAPSAVRAISSAPTWSTFAPPHLHEPHELNRSRLASSRTSAEAEVEPETPVAVASTVIAARQTQASAPAVVVWITPTPQSERPVSISCIHHDDSTFTTNLRALPHLGRAPPIA
jgi:hypothetical protein